MRELKVWLKYTINSFLPVLASRPILAIFLTGKSLRISFFLLFLNFLFQGATSLAGYSREQIIFFYLSFNLIDTLAQLLFREVYRFRPLIVSGNFDFVLTKPINPLIRVLLGGADVLDLIMLIFILAGTVWYGITYITSYLSPWLGYALLVVNGLLIASSFHILVLGLGVLTTSVDHLIMIYRDLTSLLRIPVNLYVEPIRSLLTFIIPLGMMITFPPQLLMQLLSPQLIVISLLFSTVSIYLSLKFWHFSLRHYQSASS